MGIKRNILVGLGAFAAIFTMGQSLSFYEESLPTTMNPLYARSMVDNRAHELVMDRLYFHSPINNDLTSRLVSQWQMAQGGTAMRLTLADGITWHDGEAFTANDVCFTIMTMLDESNPSPVAAKRRGDFTGCTVEEGGTALISFARIFHNPRSRLGFYILPAHVFDGNTSIQPDNEFASHPVGTGPVRGNRGRRGVAFERIQNGHHNPRVHRMSLQEGSDPLVQVRTLQNNGVQGIITVPPPYRVDVSSSDELTLKSYDLRSWWFVAVNTNKSALSDTRVRQALNLILDRTELRQLSIGVGPEEENSPCEFISGPFVQSSPYYNRAVEVTERGNIGEATRLLRAAGLRKVGGTWHHNGEPVRLRIGIKASLDIEAPDLLSQIGNQLDAAGFGRQEHKISTDEWNRLALTGQLDDYDLIVGKWSFGLVEDVNPLFHTREGSRGSLNIFNYSNEQVDGLLDQFVAARTQTAAQDAYHSLHQLLAEDLPYLFLWKLDTKSAWRTDVRGNTVSPYYYWTEFDSWRYNP